MPSAIHIDVHMNKQEGKIIEKIARKAGFTTVNALVKDLLRNTLVEGSVPNYLEPIMKDVKAAKSSVFDRTDFRKMEKDVKKMSTKTLIEALKQIDQRRINRTEVKRHSAWSPTRFFHEVQDLIDNRAPAAEVIWIAQDEVVANILGQELIMRGHGNKVPIKPIDYNEYHWNNAPSPTRSLSELEDQKRHSRKELRSSRHES